jgi:hypothetical protein
MPQQIQRAHQLRPLPDAIRKADCRELLLLADHRPLLRAFSNPLPVVSQVALLRQESAATGIGYNGDPPGQSDVTAEQISVRECSDLAADSNSKNWSVSRRFRPFRAF